MSDSPYRSAAALEDFLTEVFLSAADPGPVTRQVALKFVFSAPEACLHVDGRGGVRAEVSRGDAARALSADLTFRLSGETAHAFWSGLLNPLEAITAGKLRVEGNLLLALALAPGLRRIQTEYVRRAVVFSADGGVQ